MNERNSVVEADNLVLEIGWPLRTQLVEDCSDEGNVLVYGFGSNLITHNDVADHTTHFTFRFRRQLVRRYATFRTLSATQGLRLLRDCATLGLQILRVRGTTMTSTNQPAVIDTEQFQVTRTVHIQATAERVWAALTRDDLITHWFGQRASLPDLRVGGEGVFGFDGHGEVPLRIDEYDEPVAFAFTWGRPGDATIGSDSSTQVRFTVVADGESTILSVVESGFERLSDPVASMEGNRGGWTGELDELVAYLESASISVGDTTSK